MLIRLQLLIVLLIAPYAFAMGEGSRIDSLRQLLPQARGEDRIAILLELSEAYFGKPEAIDYAKEACLIIRQLDNPALTIKTINTLGRSYYLNYEEELALEQFFKSLEIAERTNNLEELATTFRYIGTIYRYLDSTELAFKFLNQALDLSIRNDLGLQQSNALTELAKLYSDAGANDTSVLYLKRAISIQHSKGELFEEAISYEILGDIYYDIGNYTDAIVCYKQSIKILEELGNSREIARASSRLGDTHMSLGNYQLALEQFQRSLALYESMGEKLNSAIVSTSIGLVYENLSHSPLAVEENRANYNKALEFHEQALKIFRQQQNTIWIGHSLNNIANIFFRLSDNQFVAQFGEFWEDSLLNVAPNVILATMGNAIEYYNQALEIFKQEDYPQGIALININLGRIRHLTRSWSMANRHLTLGLSIALENNLPYPTALAYFFIGDSYFGQGNFALAQENLLKSAQLARELGAKEIERYSYNILSKIKERQGDYAMALRYYRMSVLIKDEIFNENSQRAITEMQTKYETEKKEQEIALLNNQKALQASQIQRQRLMIAAAVGGFILILAFALLLLRMFQQKKRANRILEEKNLLISHQKQEITDSIRYASRIQGAVLPSPALLNETLNEYFVLFQPRDIVSGDFYWVTKHQGKVVIVAADCTGHGVPGAFMSMLGVSFLYEIVSKEGVLKPSIILDTLRELIKETLSQTGKINEQKDGMDISLGVLDYDAMKLEWAGAYNPLIIIRNKEVLEYKGDKMPVAVHINDHLHFTNHEIQLQTGDTFYMFSDGYPDQFGGEDGRKFMSKRFKQLLVEINDMPLEEQKEFLYKTHLDWRGKYEQIDDVIVLGVRV